MELGVFGEVALEAFDPDRNYRGVVTDWQGLSGIRERYDHQELEFTIPFENRLLGELHDKGSFGPRSFWASRGAEWSFRLVARGYSVPFVDCIVTHVDYEDVFNGSTLESSAANVKVQCVGWLDWVLSGRDIKTVDLKRWRRNNLKVDDIITRMIQSNIDNTGRPTGYASLPASRDNFGSFAVEVLGTNVHPTTLSRIRIDHGSSLLDSVREYCHDYGVGVSAICVQVAGVPTVTISVTYPERGNDLHTTIQFSRGLQNLKAARSSTDFMTASNVFEVRGRGWRAKQHKGWAKNQDGIDEIGVRETGEVNEDAWDQEISQELGFLQDQTAGQFTTLDADVVEGKRRWGYDYDVDDTVTLIDEKQGITTSDRITKIELNSGSPTNLIISFGHDGGADTGGGGGSIRNGGGRGHRRTGSRPARKGGEPGVPNEWEPDEGQNLQFDNANDYVEVKGDPDVPNNMVVTRGEDPGDGEGEDDDTKEKLYIRACLRDTDVTPPTTLTPVPFEFDVPYAFADTFPVDCSGTTYNVTGTVVCVGPESSRTCNFSIDIPCCPEGCDRTVTVSFAGTLHVEGELEVELPAIEKVLAACVMDCDGNVVGTRLLPAYQEGDGCGGGEMAMARSVMDSPVATEAIAKAAEGRPVAKVKIKSARFIPNPPPARAPAEPTKTPTVDAKVVSTDCCGGDTIDPADIAKVVAAATASANRKRSQKDGTP